MAAAWKAAAYVPDACHQMMALLDLWLARGIFDGRTVDAIRAAVLAQVRAHLNCIVAPGGDDRSRVRCSVPRQAQKLPQHRAFA